MINPQKKTIGDILTKSTSYVIPDYQRDFEWKRENAEDFWEDLSNGDYFIGTFVFDISKVSTKKIYVVDGQQRLTTIFILLAAIREQANRIGNDKQSFAIHNKIVFRDDTTGEQKDSKLIASEKIREVFNLTIANDKWGGKGFNFKSKKRQSNRIRPLYDFFANKLTKYTDAEIANLLERLYETFAVVIEIEKQEEAFDIFERMNSRGVDLNAADLLKNYLFARISNDEIKEDWEQIVNQSSGNIIRMIKYFYVSKFGYVSKKELFKELKGYGENTAPEKLLQEIKIFANNYSLIIGGSYSTVIDWAQQNKVNELRKEYSAKLLNRSFDAINLFGVTQSYPLFVKTMNLISSIKSEVKRNHSAKKFITFARSLENFHFINNAISQRPGNQIEKYYADVCKQSVKPDAVVDFMESIVSHLRKEKLASKIEFMQNFSNLNYENDFALIYYINDRLNNHGRDATSLIEIYNPDKKILKRNHNLEHLVSQSSKNYPYILEDDVLHSIGNLIAIGLHQNSKLQDKHISEKIELLKAEKQVLPEAFLLIEEWGTSKWRTEIDAIENIRERTKKMASRAFDIVWKI